MWTKTALALFVYYLEWNRREYEKELRIRDGKP